MAETRDLLFELGTEELPPKSLLKLRNALQQNVEQALDQADLRHGPIQAYATPRRLALLIHDLAASQPDSINEKRGPALIAAFDAQGKPTKAAEGFARSCGTVVESLLTLKTDKGEWLSFTENSVGTPTIELIPKIISAALAGLPIAKRMRWGSGPTEFVRPVHWSVLIYGEQTIRATILGTETGNVSYGHRFHAPHAITIADPADYQDRLYSDGKVIVDFEQRRANVHQLAIKAAKSVGGQALIQPDLLDEIVALVEWPTPIIGEFEQRYLELPAEILITTMQTNQKYFPVTATSGKLLPYFITFSNINSSNPETVRKGNERVIRPRLADAEFFWDKDRKTKLEGRIQALDNIIFQKKLGTLTDKTRRVAVLTTIISEKLGTNKALAQRAAILAKTDLVTDMVGEFPNLQGTMGRYYALNDGESGEVAAAIEEQYLPKQSGGALPLTQTGLILSLAEKIDTLTGIFSAGLAPSGDKDPYALRRATLGILRIIVEKELDLNLHELIEFALTQFSPDLNNEQNKASIYAFIRDRYRGYALERGYKHDEFDAVQSVNPVKPLDFERRLNAVQQFRGLAAAESLSGANKRIRNIRRKSGIETIAVVNKELLVDNEEIHLMQAAEFAATDLQPFLKIHDYAAALTRLAELHEPVDIFFDNVMVMAEDQDLRLNRLGLLHKVESLFLQIADISKLQ